MRYCSETALYDPYSQAGLRIYHQTYDLFYKIRDLYDTAIDASIGFLDDLESRLTVQGGDLESHLLFAKGRGRTPRKNHTKPRTGKYRNGGDNSGRISQKNVRARR